MLLILPFVLGTSCKEEVDLQSLRYEGRITALTDVEFGKKMEVGNIIYFRVESFHEGRSSGIETADYYLRPDYYGEIILDDD